jgi:hypothetical protein
LAAIESSKRSDVFTIDYQLAGAKAANGVLSTTFITQAQGWNTL